MMGAKQEDLVGKRFGKLLVLEFSHSDTKRRFWKCQCDCGEQTINATGTLNSGGATKCYICGRKYKEKGHSGLNTLIKLYKYDAKRRGREWNLSVSQVKEITSQNCSYCGTKPSNVIKTNTTDNHGDYLYNGIDRINNEIGYEIDNCVPCCTFCNWMKSDLTEKEFKDHVVKIYNNYIAHEL